MIGPSRFESWIDWAALIGAITWPPEFYIKNLVIPISLDESSTLLESFWFSVKRSLKLIFNLSKKLLWIDPITFANLNISYGLNSTQSENNNDIYSVSIDFLAKRFLFVLSIELVKHFLKMNSSS
jgi:hypothetical protein